MKGRSGGRLQRLVQAGTSSRAYGVTVPERLHDAIENERDNLSKADSILGCLVIAMEYQSDSVHAPYYPDVAQIARELVKKSINGLDPLHLQRRLLGNKVKEEGDLELVRREHVMAAVAAVAAVSVRLSYKARVLRLHRRNYGRPLLKNAASAVSASANIRG